MKLIFGLGNPGFVYAHSRHNIGFLVVKDIAKRQKISFKKDKNTCSLLGKGQIDGKNVLLALPLTFMNISGVALAGLTKKYRVGLEDLLVVCDDLDLEFGRLKLRPDGSSGGHRGLQSAIEAVGSGEFARLRVGIGRPGHSADAKDYVLSPFNKKERTELKGILQRSGDCAESWITQGIAETMNVFNASHKQKGRTE
ncbi:MAG: aminoacyl-tRNA hydrolase [Candidatus Omnitrophica bacterium]|nr:aminoacyl-tRNA hydrolase [Candidatus Omnitrophota bacterium]